VSTAYDGRRLLVDQSAFVRSGHHAVVDEYSTALLAGQLFLAPASELELMYSARDATDLDRVDASIGAYRRVDFDASLWTTARQVLRDLAAQGPLHRRVALPDVLVAVAADAKQLDVLHYEAHYDRLSSVLTFDSVWIAPEGSLSSIQNARRPPG
jgi:predicted nucleic acid-binding protein